MNPIKKFIRKCLGDSRYYHLQGLLRSRSLERFSAVATSQDDRIGRTPSPFPFVVDSQNPLEELGDKYRPTKREHNYLKWYWLHLRDVREHVTNVCEIGVQTDKSVRMWREFFPQATIWGLDIDPACQSFASDRIKIRIGDQSNAEFLRSVLDESGPFDIIIDDGSHLVKHQLATFNYLFPHLTDHGIYVMEDTGGLVGDPALTTINRLKALIDNVMFWPEGMSGADWPSLTNFDGHDATWGDRNIIGVAFYRWLAFVFRGHNPEDNKYLHTGGGAPGAEPEVSADN